MNDKTKIEEMLATVEKLKAEQGAVRDKIRDALSDLSDLDENAELAYTLLEEAADLIGELV